MSNREIWARTWRANATKARRKSVRDARANALTVDIGELLFLSRSSSFEGSDARCVAPILSLLQFFP